MIPVREVFQSLKLRFPQPLPRVSHRYFQLERAILGVNAHRIAFDQTTLRAS